MLIRYFSDLHVEFGSRELTKRLAADREADVIVCAGDLKPMGEVGRYLHLLDDVTHCPFLFVPGNHEYYGARKDEVDQELADHSYHNVHILNRASVRIKDVLFIGATGWWEQVSAKSRSLINDFGMISGITRADHGAAWGRQDKQFFIDALQQAEGMPVVCISHHALTMQSIPQSLHGRTHNDCYANQWDELIMEYQPAAWIHGHIHQTSSDYMVGRTRVISNPYGYKRKNKINPAWDEHAAFEV